MPRPHPVVTRIMDAWRAGWTAAVARWRQVADVPAASQRRTSFFDCDLNALPSLRSADDAEAAAWYRAHFPQGWPRR